MRNEHLLTNKYFICHCDRCLDPTELNSNLSSLKCIGDIGKDCGGIVLPKNPIDTTTKWTCDKCDIEITNDQIEILLSNIEQEVDELILPIVSKRKHLATINELNALIDKLSHFLHENHFHLFGLKHTLLQRLGRESGYNLDAIDDKELQRKIHLCEQLLEIVDTLDPYTMRLTLYTGIILYELQAALRERENRRIKNESNGQFDKNVEGRIQQCIERGKDAVSLNSDVVQGKKLIELFNSLQI